MALFTLSYWQVLEEKWTMGRSTSICYYTRRNYNNLPSFGLRLAEKGTGRGLWVVRQVHLIGFPTSHRGFVQPFQDKRLCTSWRPRSRYAPNYDYSFFPLATERDLRNAHSRPAPQLAYGHGAHRDPLQSFRPQGVRSFLCHRPIVGHEKVKMNLPRVATT